MIDTDLDQGIGNENRRDCQNLEHEVYPYLEFFLYGLESHILRIGEMMRQTD